MHSPLRRLRTLPHSRRPLCPYDQVVRERGGPLRHQWCQALWEIYIQAHRLSQTQEADKTKNPQYFGQALTVLLFFLEPADYLQCGGAVDRVKRCVCESRVRNTHLDPQRTVLHPPRTGILRQVIDVRIVTGPIISRIDSDHEHTEFLGREIGLIASVGANVQQPRIRL